MVQTPTPSPYKNILMRARLTFVLAIPFIETFVVPEPELTQACTVELLQILNGITIEPAIMILTD